MVAPALLLRPPNWSPFIINCSSRFLLLSSSPSSSSSSSPPSTSHLTAVHADCLPSAWWYWRQESYHAAAEAGGRNPRIGMPITLLSLKKKRFSPFSERSSRGSSGRREEAPPISAANGQAERRQAMLLSTDDGDDDHGKFAPAADEDDKALLHSEAKVLTLPTILTLGRIAAIPVLLFVFFSNEWWATTTVACIFVLAALTDWLDGFLARKMGSNSTFGAFLDPVADKLMVATALVLLSTEPLHVSWAASLPWLIPLPSTAIIGREITMSAVREWAASQGGDLQAAVAVNKLGKWKTASQMVALTVLLATRNDSMACMLVAVGVGLLYISAGLALWSLAVYMKGIWGALIK